VPMGHRHGGAEQVLTRSYSLPERGTRNEKIKIKVYIYIEREGERTIEKTHDI